MVLQRAAAAHVSVRHLRAVPVSDMDRPRHVAAIASTFPPVVTVFGGQQSARTIHFFVSVFLSLFLLVHVVMVCRSGFRNRMRAMIAGRIAAQKEQI